MKPAVHAIAVAVLTGMVSVMSVAQPLTSGWIEAKSPHFIVYSHSDGRRASALLQRFEGLNLFFERNRMGTTWSGPGDEKPVEVIEFQSKNEYEAFKTRATADAYFVNNANGSYVVLPPLGPTNFGIAAHEYAHFVLHSAGFRFPLWLSEGMAEVFSTVRISDRECEIGGSIAQHVAELRRTQWLSARQLLTANAAGGRGGTREQTRLFYAESWAVVATLMEDPRYAPQFGNLMRALQSGNISSESAFAAVYHVDVESLFASVRDRVAENSFHRQVLAGIATFATGAETQPVSDFDAGVMIADLLFASDALDRAEQAYTLLLRQAPANGDVAAALGMIELKKGNRGAALVYWRKAMELGVRNADLCYRYSLLTDDSNGPPAEIRRGLEAAIQLNPHLDDAHWRLGLLLSNQSDFAGAVEQFQAMRAPKPERAYAYWLATAYALSQLEKREEAQAAAERALAFAKTDEERTRAADIAYDAKTDLAVRFARDKDGQLQMITTRVPHGSTDFNPFVEPEDRIHLATGELREVQCADGRLMGLVVQSQDGLLRLSVPDPFHVLIRNGPSQLNCGAQKGTGVTVEYAASEKADEGVLRGMRF